MTAPETLLRMHPLDALRAQIEPQLNAPLKAHHLKIEPPTSLGGTLTSIWVDVDKSKAPLELWDRKGPVEFRYHRLNLPDFTKGLDLTLKTLLPTTAPDLLRAILQPYAIPVADNDITQAVVDTPGPATLISDALSWRWVGEIQALVERVGIDVLSQILVNRFSLPFDEQFYSTNIKSRLLAFLNLANPGIQYPKITSAMFSLSEPAVNGPISSGDNTLIYLVFNNMPYAGSLPVTYARRGFENSFRHPVKLSGNQPGYTSELAGRLSTQMGCTVTAADIQSEPFVTLKVGERQRVAVKFNLKSLAYVGTVLVEYSRTT